MQTELLSTNFQAPEKHAGWPGDAPFNANEFGPSCIQPQGELVPDFSVNPRQDEDCLQLNVWTAEVILFGYLFLHLDQFINYNN